MLSASEFAKFIGVSRETAALFCNETVRFLRFCETLAVPSPYPRIGDHSRPSTKFDRSVEVGITKLEQAPMKGQ
jgi:hypothetical protein